MASLFDTSQKYTLWIYKKQKRQWKLIGLSILSLHPIKIIIFSELLNAHGGHIAPHHIQKTWKRNQNTD